ncbi:MAG: M6 family metalloprotease domain-containing protein, partial [Nocardioidaceae bacterium]
HFQILHAGAGEAAGAPVYGEDAIWSHSWYVNATDIGVTGPGYNPAGGEEIGDTGIWVGNYLTEPENAGLGVLAHEYGHDLGLPDEYDTTYTGEASSAFWTLMSSGSYMSLPQDEGIGTRALDLDAWDKLQLGWLDYQIATPGQKRRYKLGPVEYNSRKAQGLVVVLPDKQVTTEYGPPYAGDHMWWSTKGNDMTTTMSHEFDLTGTSSAEMTLKARYDIEEGYDFAYAEASTDGGDTWTALDGTVNGQPFPRDGGGRPALTGSTGDDWADIAIPMDSLAGSDVMFRFRYTTDPAVAGDGLFTDELALTADGETVFSDGAEEGTDGWSTDGFTITTGTETKSYDNFYIVGNKNYVSYDKTLSYGPYNFGFPDKPNYVEHYPYQDGVLISYWDTSYANNNVGEHPGHGQILPIDAHPRPLYNMEGQPWRTRLQVYDATFGRQRVDSLQLHVNGKPSYVRGGSAKRTFNDHKKYWYASKPDAGVKVPGTGTKIKVLRERGTSVVLRVKAPKIG